MQRKKRFVIGVTGGIATGKSALMALLDKAGIPGVSADDLAHACLKRERPAYRRTVNFFGPGILTPQKEIDRRRLGEIVFKDPAARKRLEGFVHPCVKKSIQRFLRTSRGAAAVDIPLLYEARYQRHVDHVVVVRSTRAQQIARLMRRNGLTRRQALDRIHAQWPLAKKCRLADSVLDNSKTPAHFEKAFRAWLARLLDQDV